VQLDQLSVVLRQRNPFEAIDLGFAMVREWWRDIYVAWLAVFVPIALAAWLALPPLWAALAVWWLKPAFDRVILHVVASEVFGSRPRLRTTLLSYFSYASNGLLLSLVPLPFLRLQVTRSFDLPIRQLEDARGAIARQRGRQLRSRVWTQASVLTIVCLLFEVVVFFSLVGLYDMLVPATTQDTFAAFTLFEGQADGSRNRLLTTLYFVAIALIEPLYVSGGFALYLNRRTALEGWDLEVQLRRIAQRTAEPDAVSSEPARSALMSVLVVAMTAGLLAIAPDPASAQDTALQQPPTAPARSHAAQEIKKILERKEFPHYETQTLILPLQKPEEPSAKRKDLSAFVSFMQFIAEIVRGLAWVLLALVVLFALYWLLRRLDWIRVPEQTRWTAPTTLFGLDVRPDSLPDDVAAAALELLRLGNLLEALSLLYRGALVTLLHRDQVQLTGGDTESDCLVKTRERVPANTHAYLARLLLAWQGAAYAHRVPARLDVERLATEWPGYFGPAT
jgi:hypothetical protein